MQFQHSLPTRDPLSTRSLGNTVLRCIGYSPSTTFPAPHDTDDGYRALCRPLACLYHHNRENKHPRKIPRERKYRQTRKDKRKDVRGAHLSRIFQGQSPLGPTPERRSYVCLNLRSVLFQLKIWPSPEFKNERVLKCNTLTSCQMQAGKLVWREAL